MSTVPASPQASAAMAGAMLRQWRDLRGRSQLDLALDAGVSQKHVSFVESGRSRPSPQMVIALAEALDVPLRERNAILLAAGYAPRYDIEALAEDVIAVTGALGIGRYVLVGHSMRKVAQLAAGRRPPGLVGLVLIAPAPPTPMAVPVEVRAGMLAFYQSREGAIRALAVLAGSPLDEGLRRQVIDDTLRGHADAKRSWPEHGMSADVSAADWQDRGAGRHRRGRARPGGA